MINEEEQFLVHNAIVNRDDGADGWKSQDVPIPGNREEHFIEKRALTTRNAHPPLP